MSLREDEITELASDMAQTFRKIFDGVDALLKEIPELTLEEHAHQGVVAALSILLTAPSHPELWAPISRLPTVLPLTKWKPGENDPPEGSVHVVRLDGSSLVELMAFDMGRFIPLGTMPLNRETKIRFHPLRLTLPDLARWVEEAAIFAKGNDVSC